MPKEINISAILDEFNDKFPFLRVYGCKEHYPDEHFCENEIKSFIRTKTEEILREMVVERWDRDLANEGDQFIDICFSYSVDTQEAKYQVFSLLLII
jgi:hypothetical protein